MPRTIATVVLSLLATLLVAGATAAPATAAPARAAAAPATDFYTPPTKLPAAPGALVRSEPQKLAVSIGLLGGETLPGKATRIMYRSTDAAGKAVAVTGSYIDSATPWTGPGPRPVVAFAAGTQGQGDACAPSKALSSPITITPGSLALGYESLAIYQLLGRGVNVVLTDYVGLGTTDRVHTYTNRLDMGHALLDAARAAFKLPGTTLGKDAPVGLYGYSQGGGASGAAAELAPTYAPELKIRGAYVGAPPANLLQVLDTIDGSALTGLVGYAINGLTPYSARLRSILDRETNARGKQVLQQVSTQCVGDTLLTFGFQRTNAWTRNGESAGALVRRIPEALAAIEAQRIGKLKPKAPVLLLSGTQDDIVPHAQARQLGVDWCRKGAKVDFRPVQQLLPSGGTALNHLTPVFAEGNSAQVWLVERLRGVPAPSTCASNLGVR